MTVKKKPFPSMRKRCFFMRSLTSYRPEQKVLLVSTARVGCRASSGQSLRLLWIRVSITDYTLMVFIGCVNTYYRKSYFPLTMTYAIPS